MGLTTDSGKVLGVADAEKDQAEFRKSVNSRIVHPLKPWIVDAKRKKIHVINVGPWEHTVWAGSYGSFTLPACPRGTPYVEMLTFDAATGKWVSPISAVQTENVIKNEAEMEMQDEDGRRFAWEILGEGRGQNQVFSLRHRGCTVIEGEIPTEDELLEAKLELEEECRRLVAEARELYASNEPFARQAIVKGRHDVAAQILNLTDEPWLIARNPEGRQKCKICGTMSDAGVLKCGACKEYVFDQVAYAKLIAEQEAAMKPKGK